MEKVRNKDMKIIKKFEAFTSDKGSATINRIRKVYSKFMNMPEFDMDQSNDYDIIWKSSFTDDQYKQFIKKLEDEFEIPILDGVWNDDESFQDLTDDKYRTFNGLEAYINWKKLEISQQ